MNLGPLQAGLPELSGEEFERFRYLAIASGEADKSPNERRIHHVVLNLGGAFIDWVNDTAGVMSQEGHDLLQRNYFNPPESFARVPGTGVRSSQFHVTRERHHDPIHGYGLPQKHPKKHILPRIRRTKTYTPYAFEPVTAPDTMRTYWNLSRVNRTGTRNHQKIHLLGATLWRRPDVYSGTDNLPTWTVAGVEIYHNRNGAFKVDNQNNLRDLSRIPETDAMLPSNVTTLNVLARAAQFATHNNLDPENLINRL